MPDPRIALDTAANDVTLCIETGSLPLLLNIGKPLAFSLLGSLAALSLVVHVLVSRIRRRGASARESTD